MELLSEGRGKFIGWHDPDGDFIAGGVFGHVGVSVTSIRQ